MNSPIDLAPEYWATVERILAAHVPRCEVRAFGSRATWTAWEYSDLDLAIIGNDKVELTVLGDLREAFEESDLPISVDVVDWHAISDSFRERIEPDSVVVQQAPNPTDWRHY